MSVFLTFLKLRGISQDAPPPPQESARTKDVRSYADVITKFSQLDGLPIFLTHGASLAHFARWSSAIIEGSAGLMRQRSVRNGRANGQKFFILFLNWVWVCCSGCGFQENSRWNAKHYLRYPSLSFHDWAFHLHAKNRKREYAIKNGENLLLREVRGHTHLFLSIFFFLLLFACIRMSASDPRPLILG